MSERPARIATNQIPQANSLASIRAVVEAVCSGAVTTRDIGTAAALTPRHVRYYVLAAQTLGWLRENCAQPVVTGSGSELLATKKHSLAECDVNERSVTASSVLSAVAGP